MAARKPKTAGKGILIRGADGALYHIPGDRLKAYRLPDALTQETRTFLDQKGLTAKKGKIPAFHAPGLVAPAKKGVLVQGKAVLTKGGKAVLTKAGKPVLAKGGKAVLVKAKRAVLLKGQKAVLVNLNKVKALAKGK